MLFLLGGTFLSHLLEILHHNLSVLLQNIYSTIYLYCINIHTDVGIYVLVIIQNDFILLLKLFQLWPLRVLPLSLQVSLTYSWICASEKEGESEQLLKLPSFPALQGLPCLSCIFPALVLELIISPRSPGSFNWRVVLEPRSVHELFS